MTANTEAAIWERLIEADRPDLVSEAAQFLLRLDFREADHERMAELSEKSNDGTLSDDERTELQNYVHVGNFLALMQSKARRSLNPRAQAS
ncbi:MAG TPA: hypothetical protein VIM11_16990 [Tepidisphaeraceae bacterium]|jgi:hypothetical protein